MSSGSINSDYTGRLHLSDEQAHNRKVFCINLLRVVFFLLAAGAALSSLGLVAASQPFDDSDVETSSYDICALYLSNLTKTRFGDIVPQSYQSTCILTLTTESITIIFLVVLAIVTFIRLALGATDSNIIVLVDLILMIISILFILTPAVTLFTGWSVTCANNKCEKLNAFAKMTAAVLCVIASAILVIISSIVSCYITKKNRRLAKRNGNTPVNITFNGYQRI